MPNQHFKYVHVWVMAAVAHDEPSIGLPYLEACIECVAVGLPGQDRFVDACPVPFHCGGEKEVVI